MKTLTENLRVRGLGHTNIYGNVAGIVVTWVNMTQGVCKLVWTLVETLTHLGVSFAGYLYTHTVAAVVV